MNEKSFWNRPLVLNITTVVACVVPVVVLIGSLPARMAAVENAQHETTQKLDRVAEGVARIEGRFEDRRQHVAFNP